MPAATHDEKIRIMKAKRDAKAQQHLSQYAPVWLMNEVDIPEEDALQFEAVFYHPQYHWVKRRYRYDSYQDVLYQKGQLLMTEEESLALQAQAPYIDAPILNTVNSYGG